MTDCEACTRAEADLTSGLYQSGCLSCEARVLVGSPAGSAAAKAAAIGEPGDLQALMRLLWPDVEKYRKGRALVWVWLKRLRGGE